MYVELPEEEEEGEGREVCGKLLKSMYGTRDAAQNWDRAHAGFIKEIGFGAEIASPCVFKHEGRNMKAVVHGDDFTIIGRSQDSDWLHQKISTRFEVKFKGRLGQGKGDDKEIRIINRIITLTEAGIEYEADQRHAEMIVQQLEIR